MFSQVTRVALAAGIVMSSLGIATVAGAQPYHHRYHRYYHHWHHRYHRYHRPY